MKISFLWFVRIVCNSATLLKFTDDKHNIPLQGSSSLHLFIYILLNVGKSNVQRKTLFHANNIICYCPHLFFYMDGFMSFRTHFFLLVQNNPRLVPRFKEHGSLEKSRFQNQYCF